MAELNEVANQVVDIFKNNKDFFEDCEWTAYYNKYNEEVLAFKDGWNFQVSNLSDECLTDNLYINAQKLEPFYTWLGERISLCLNLMRGETNEQLKLEYEKQKGKV